MSRTITFQPNKNQVQLIEVLLESGGYNNQSEVIREGLRLLEEKHAKSKLKQLRNLIDEGENSGELLTWDAQEFLTRMKKEPHA
jgi:antitoxin ParD1/3/4